MLVSLQQLRSQSHFGDIVCDLTRTSTAVQCRLLRVMRQPFFVFEEHDIS